MARFRNSVHTFWPNVDHGRVDRCWNWKRWTDADGYGSFSVKAEGVQYQRAHRYAYFLAFKVQPGDRMVCHHCDNPACCNPAHLFLGTAMDNNTDKRLKGRSPCGPKHGRQTKPECTARGSRNGIAIFDEAQVAEIRRRYSAGELQREIAATLDCAQTTISAIVRGVGWRHVPQP